MKLMDILTEEFPLNHVGYNYIMDELCLAAYGIVLLHLLVCLHGTKINTCFMKARADFNQIWNLFQKTERQFAASIVVEQY